LPVSLRTYVHHLRYKPDETYHDKLEDGAYATAKQIHLHPLIQEDMLSKYHFAFSLSPLINIWKESIPYQVAQALSFSWNYFDFSYIYQRYKTFQQL
ncbi:hypothetical protein MKC94_21200, partial [[Clostridium] innocuum]|nr:hypothetical protein [[Clostridium] innocuum]